jgi:leucine dehydrogenase
MEITEIRVPGYRRVARALDRSSGLHAIISVHDTTMGPSLGGLRMWPYASEDEALFDVKRLSKGMTYKSAIAATGVGGGKAVIIGDPSIKSEALYLAMGRFVDAFRGEYITAEDVNTTTADLEVIRRATRYVTGLPEEMGGSGNPSPFTAYGVFLGIEAALEWIYGEPSAKARRVGVQGVGAVGSALVRHLVKAGARVSITDTNNSRVAALVEELGVQGVRDGQLFDLDLDVLAPCALGAVINDESLPRLRCRIVAGAANNPLLEPRHGRMLDERGILYAPDYVINAGGIINVSAELAEGGYDRAAACQRIERIPHSLRDLWELARTHGIPPSEAADQLAERLLEEARAAAGGAAV